MKVKIKEYFGELPCWLTVDRVYDAQSRSEHTFILDSDDEGCCWTCLFHNCPNLNGGSWEIVNE